MTTSTTMTIGCDLGDRYSPICAIDGSGDIIERTRVRSTPRGFTKLFEHRDRARIVIEVGAHSRWVSHLLETLGHEVIVANSR